MERARTDGHAAVIPVSISATARDGAGSTPSVTHSNGGGRGGAPTDGAGGGVDDVGIDVGRMDAVGGSGSGGGGGGGGDSGESDASGDGGISGGGERAVGDSGGGGERAVGDSGGSGDEASDEHNAWPLEHRRVKSSGNSDLEYVIEPPRRSMSNPITERPSPAVLKQGLGKDINRSVLSRNPQFTTHSSQHTTHTHNIHPAINSLQPTTYKLQHATCSLFSLPQATTTNEPPYPASHGLQAKADGSFSHSRNRARPQPSMQHNTNVCSALTLNDGLVPQLMFALHSC
jgi:hypothetical protein